MIKKYIYLIILTLLFTPLYGAIDINKCDSIKQKAQKIDCLTKLRADAIKQKAMGPLKKINKKMKSYTDKKKDFDKENKTLWQMYKNIKQNEGN